MSKASKKRFCPAAQRDISSGECGEKRNSSYNCPPECKFSPFAPENYSQVLDMDTAVNGKMMNYLFEHSGSGDEIARESRRVEAMGGRSALDAWFVWKFFYERGADGLTWAARWEKAGYPGLKNDERVLMKARQTTRPALIEVQRVLDNEQVEVVDYLEAQPKPFILRDRSVAARAVRFSTLVTWITNQPHYGRFIGSGVTMGEIPELTPLQVLSETVRHLGGPEDLPGIRLWLAHHFARFHKALDAIGLARQEETVKGVDSRQGTVLYELRRPFGEARDLLDNSGNVGIEPLSARERDEGFSLARYWADEEKAKGMLAQTTPVLGRVLLGQSHWRLDAMSEEKTRDLKKRFQKLMGDSVKFIGERFDDHQSPSGTSRRYDKELIPPRLLENTQRISMFSSRVHLPENVAAQTKQQVEADFFKSLDKNFLDEPIPALEGKTPRQAAKDAELRPKLILLMKSRVRSQDERNFESGRQDDINWMLQELELQEINFPPPPVRKWPDMPEAPQANDFEDAMDDLLLAKAPDQPITDEKAEELHLLYRTWFEDDADALAASDDSASDFLYFASELTENFISEDSFNLLLPALLRARFALVPPGYLEPEMHYERAAAELKFLHGQFASFSFQEASKKLHPLLAQSKHPGLLSFCVTSYIAMISGLPQNEKPTSSELSYSIVALRVMIDELDASLREQPI